MEKVLLFCGKDSTKSAGLMLSEYSFFTVVSVRAAESLIQVNFGSSNDLCTSFKKLVQLRKEQLATALIDVSADNKSVETIVAWLIVASTGMLMSESDSLQESFSTRYLARNHERCTTPSVSPLHRLPRSFQIGPCLVTLYAQACVAEMGSSDQAWIQASDNLSLGLMGIGKSLWLCAI